MKTFTALSIVCVLTVPNVAYWYSEASGACTPQERIELGNQGYDKNEVQKACADDAEEFWDNLSKELSTGLASSLTKGLNQALGIRDNNATSAPSGGNASACVTNVVTCPLPGGPQGYPCYCRAWNGTTISGVSR